MAKVCIVLAIAFIAVVAAAPQSPEQRQFLPASNPKPENGLNTEDKDLQGAASYGYGYYGNPYGYGYGGYGYPHYGLYGGFGYPYYGHGFGGLYGGYGWY